jgi:hypothetical protein
MHWLHFCDMRPTRNELDEKVLFFVYERVLTTSVDNIEHIEGDAEAFS